MASEFLAFVLAAEGRVGADRTGQTVGDLRRQVPIIDFVLNNLVNSGSTGSVLTQFKSD